jgi:hypothetical protein
MAAAEIFAMEGNEFSRGWEVGAGNLIAKLRLTR